MNKNYLSNFEYCGNIKLTLKNGNKIIKQTNIHNTGYAALFKFLSLCLCGQYKVAEIFRPTYIQLFNKTATGELSQITNRILLNTTPVADTVDNKNVAILHFRIPHSYIINSNFSINYMCLYNTNNDLCASFELSDEAIIDKDDFKDNYNLIVEWTMSIDNKEIN